MSNYDYIVESLWPLVVPIGEVHLDMSNARTGHALECIAASLSQYKQRKPIVVNKAEGNKIEAGNGTWQAAKLLEWSHIAVVLVDDDPMTAVGYGIADNRLGDLSNWDAEVLQQLLDGLDPDLALETGFDEGELDSLLLELDGVFSSGDNAKRCDAEPQISRGEVLMKEWQTAPGQLWRLPSRTNGHEHLLICGDCTRPEIVKQLMGETRAVLFATDPPYLVGYDGKNHPQSWGESSEIVAYQDWDRPADERGLYEGFIAMAVSFAIVENAAWYCWHASKRRAFLEGIWEQVGAFVHQEIVWMKNRPVMTRSWYLWQHEPCLFGWIKGNMPKRCDQARGRTIWEFDTVMVAEDIGHPTSKPIELFEIPMQQHTEVGDLCYEPFCGSGSQIVAAENLGRQCRAVELAPQYVAVILQRYQDAFGITPELVTNGD